MLLAQSGAPGRACANHLLWDLCSDWALDRTYEDLSHKVTSMVAYLRKHFDRPPANHWDLDWWTWRAYEEPWGEHAPFDPRQGEVVPKIKMGPEGELLKPPACWSFSP